MELNKIFAAVLVAGIIGMSTGFIAESLVAPEELQQNAYFVDLGQEAPTIVVEEAPLPDPVLPLLASADVDAGQALAQRACGACHTFQQGQPNRTGPNQWDVVGGPVAHLDNFNYSGTLTDWHDEGRTWGYEELNGFIAAPRDYAPGTTMSYAGLRDVQDRANVIAYLRTLSDEPMALPTQEDIDALLAERAGESEAGDAAGAEDAATTGDAGDGDAPAAAPDAAPGENGGPVDEPATDEQVSEPNDSAAG